MSGFSQTDKVDFFFWGGGNWSVRISQTDKSSISQASKSAEKLNCRGFLN